jgi:hypothetical protein
MICFQHGATGSNLALDCSRKPGSRNYTSGARRQISTHSLTARKRAAGADSMESALLFDARLEGLVRIALTCILYPDMTTPSKGSRSTGVSLMYGLRRIWRRWLDVSLRVFSWQKQRRRLRKCRR